MFDIFSKMVYNPQKYLPVLPLGLTFKGLINNFVISLTGICCISPVGVITC